VRFPFCDEPFLEREEPCFSCNGECGFDDGEPCTYCNATGTEWRVPQPVTIDDLSEMCGDEQ
jgi:hypothetical protein